MIRSIYQFAFGIAVFVALVISVSGDERSPWRAHDLRRPTPPIVSPARNESIKPAPSDAIVLFDGKDVSQWQSADGSETKWVMENGELIATAGSGPIRTKQAFGDVQLHIEWAAPTPPEGTSQGRGNSGVYFMGKYEVQILDSYENVTYADGQAASMYGQNPPLVNACLPPGEWQTYDIIFHRPRFAEDGSLQKAATMTVIQNGVLVQDHFELWGPTNWLKFGEYAAHADKLPISLQDHGNPVRFRNIWVRELREQPRYKGLAEVYYGLKLKEEQLRPLLGKFDDGDSQSFEIRLVKGRLQLGIEGRYFDLVAKSPTSFSFKRTFAEVDFELDENQQAREIVVNVMGEIRKAKRND